MALGVALPVPASCLRYHFDSIFGRVLETGDTPLTGAGRPHVEAVEADGLDPAVAACLALLVGATAIATSPNDSSDDGLGSKAAVATAWPDEKKVAWSAGLDKKVVCLAQRGITVETIEITPGVRDIVWTVELKRALKDIGGGTK